MDHASAQIHDHPSSDHADEPPLHILSLDGGGIRGISSLLILEHIMERIREAEGLDEVPRPCDRFDMIGGTSTGGLRMTVDECIRAYKKMAKKAFTPKPRSRISLPGSPRGAFSATSLEEAIRDTIKEFCPVSECAIQRKAGNSTSSTCTHEELLFRDKSCTATVVLSVTKANVIARPILFTTYDTSAALANCTIWQVARATSAATTFFKPIRVGRDEVELIDAGLGYNNPCEALIQEAKQRFSEHRDMRFLSIGTGLGGVIKIRDSRRSIIEALKKMAMTSKQAAYRLDRRFGDDGRYFRFDVQQGLEDITIADWEEASTISALTQNYLNDSKTRVDQFVDFYLGRKQPSGAQLEAGLDSNAATAQAGVPHRQVYYDLQFSRNDRFVGREHVLEEVRGKLFGEGAKPVAVCGLGGVGKTQVALQTAYWVKDNKKDWSIVWLPAWSMATFEQACSKLVASLNIQVAENEDVKETARQHFDSDASGNWLLIVDNADDMQIMFGKNSDGIDRYLPRKEGTRLLLTTRSTEVALAVTEYDDRRVVELSQMSPEECRDFWDKLKPGDSPENIAAVPDLFRELTYLPLAISQAAAYMKVKRISVAIYLSLLQARGDNMVGLLSREFHDTTRYKESTHAVARTWLVSFDQIRATDEAAARLLSFLSQIEPRAIPRDILPVDGTEEELVHAIGTLNGYAFLEKHAGDEIFDMHRLVHLAARVWVADQNNIAKAREAAMAHLEKIFPTDEWENREKWRSYMPHVLAVLRLDGVYAGWTEEGRELSLGAAICIRQDGQLREAVSLLEYRAMLEATLLEEEDPDRLCSQHHLAWTYIENGQAKEAISLLEHVVEVQTRILSQEHPDQLASQHMLAGAYTKNGQVKKAISLLEHVVAVEARILSQEDPDRLTSQYGLAWAYTENDQAKEAISLLEHVVAVQTRILSQEHPDQLTSQHELARAYAKNGQVKEAISLLEHVVAVKARILSQEHPDRLASQHELAGAYANDRQVERAIPLLEYVVAVKARILSQEHPDRLASQHELARVYALNGQAERALPIIKHVVDIQAKLLGKDSPSRLVSERMYDWIRSCVEVNSV